MDSWTSTTTDYLLDTPDNTINELMDFFIKGYTECHQAIKRGEDPSAPDVIERAMSQYFKKGVRND